MLVKIIVGVIFWIMTLMLGLVLVSNLRQLFVETRIN